MRETSSAPRRVIKRRTEQAHRNGYYQQAKQDLQHGWHDSV
jgi:hypothetical protein